MNSQETTQRQEGGTDQQQILLSLHSLLSSVRDLHAKIDRHTANMQKLLEDFSDDEVDLQWHETHRSGTAATPINKLKPKEHIITESAALKEEYVPQKWPSWWLTKDGDPGMVGHDWAPPTQEPQHNLLPRQRTLGLPTLKEQQ